MFKTRKVEPTYISYDERKVLKSLIKIKVENTLNKLCNTALENLEEILKIDPAYQETLERISSIEETVKSFNEHNKGKGFRATFTDDFYKISGERDDARNELFRKHFPFEYRIHHSWNLREDISLCISYLDTENKMAELRDVTKATQTVVEMMKELYS